MGFEVKNGQWHQMEEEGNEPGVCSPPTVSYKFYKTHFLSTQDLVRFLKRRGGGGANTRIVPPKSAPPDFKKGCLVGRRCVRRRKRCGVQFSRRDACLPGSVQFFASSVSLPSGVEEEEEEDMRRRPQRSWCAWPCTSMP